MSRYYKGFLFLSYILMSSGILLEAYLQNFFFPWIYMFFIGVLSVFFVRYGVGEKDF